MNSVVYAEHPPSHLESGSVVHARPRVPTCPVPDLGTESLVPADAFLFLGKGCALCGLTGRASTNSSRHLCLFPHQPVAHPSDLTAINLSHGDNYMLSSTSPSTASQTLVVWACSGTMMTSQLWASCGPSHHRGSCVGFTFPLLKLALHYSRCVSMEQSPCRFLGSEFFLQNYLLQVAF